MTLSPTLDAPTPCFVISAATKTRVLISTFQRKKRGMPESYSPTNANFFVLKLQSEGPVGRGSGVEAELTAAALRQADFETATDEKFCPSTVTQDIWLDAGDRYVVVMDAWTHKTLSGYSVGREANVVFCVQSSNAITTQECTLDASAMGGALMAKIKGSGKRRELTPEICFYNMGIGVFAENSGSVNFKMKQTVTSPSGMSPLRGEWETDDTIPPGTAQLVSYAAFTGQSCGHSVSWGFSTVGGRPQSDHKPALRSKIFDPVSI